MTASQWLIDKSALVRLSRSIDAADWANRIDRRLVRITTFTLLSGGLLRTQSRRTQLRAAPAPVLAMPVEYLTWHHR